jgi:hypothetical protein
VKERKYHEMAICQQRKEYRRFANSRYIGSKELPLGPKKRRANMTDASKAGWSWGCVAAIDSQGRTIWIADAHRDDGKRFVVRADES